jgi:predicted RNase H-like HicB family nuclease
MKTTDFSKARALVCDTGLFFPLALRLARPDGFAEVGYHSVTWQKGFPSYHEYDVGKGFDNVKHEPYLWDVIDDYDILIFPDVLRGDLQQYLRKQGYRVFGSGKGDELELFRAYMKQVMERVDLPVQPYKIIKGLDKLRDYLEKEKEDVFVKISLLRGITETFRGYCGKNFWLLEPRLDEMANNLQVRKNEMNFIVEDDIKTKIEYGIDTICIDGKFPKIAANGTEIKDCAYAAVVQDYKNLPDGMQLVNERLAPILAEYEYRNFFSTEIRVADDDTPYLIDLTCRHASPAGEAQHELWGNLAEMIWMGAAGVLVEPEPTAKFAVQSIILSDRAEENWTPISFPEKFRDNMKLYFHTRINNHDYVVPQIARMNEIGSIVTTGNTLQEAIDANMEIAEQVKGDKVEIHTDKIPKLIEAFKEMESKEIDLTPFE